MVTALKRAGGGEGSKCENWRLEKSCVHRNSFFGLLLTSYVHDGRLPPIRFLKKLH